MSKLYLIPTTLGDSLIGNVIPSYNIDILNNINFFIVEKLRTARRFLVKAGIQTKIDDLTFYTLNKHTDKNDLHSFLAPIEKGENIGIISEAGCPGVADPGSEIVSIAHQKNISVVPLIGPSSILLSLMASGFNGQNFSFIGYLPIKEKDRINKIIKIENKVYTEKQTQIFIETPYRNQSLLNNILNTCKAYTKLCIATDITLDTEYIKTKTVKTWKQNKPNIHKRPTIFLLGEGS